VNVRPAIASGPALAVGEARSILDEASRPDARPWALVLRAGDAPWSDAWPALALCVGDQSLVVPHVGGWPVAAEDPDMIAPSDLVAALRTVVLAPRNPIDPGITAEGAESLRRTASRHVLRAMTEGDPIPARLASGSGAVTCEIGMDEDGTPIVWMLSANQHEAHQLVAGARDRAPPLAAPQLLAVRSMSLMADGLPDGECVVLHPRCNDEAGISVEVGLPGPIDVMRHIADAAAGLPVVHARSHDQRLACAFVDAAHAAISTMNGDPRRCRMRFENRCEGSISMSLAVILPQAVGGVTTLVVSNAPDWSFDDLPRGIVEDHDALPRLEEIRRALCAAHPLRDDFDQEALLRSEARDWIAAATIHMPEALRDPPPEGWSIIVEREASTGGRFVPVIDQKGTMEDDFRLDHCVPKDLRAAILARNPTNLRLTIVDETAILAPTDVSGDILVIEHDTMDMMRRIAALREPRH
jgi:hypothetical protein